MVHQYVVRYTMTFVFWEFESYWLYYSPIFVKFCNVALSCAIIFTIMDLYLMIEILIV